MDICNKKLCDLVNELEKIPHTIEDDCNNVDAEYIMVNYEGNNSDSIIDRITKHMVVSRFFYKMHVDSYNSFCKIIKSMSQILITELNEQKCSNKFYDIGCKYYENLKEIVYSMNSSNSVSTIKFNITSIKFADNSETSVDMVTVNSNDELFEYPPGLLVYHTGYKIPKFILTTGNKNDNIEVPISCNIVGAEDDLLRKYTIFNNSILINKNFNAMHNNFYIDKEVSRITGIPEDETRNFRHPMQNNKKQWNGYNVFKQPKFGDSTLLDEQLTDNISSDKRDLYQYSLWMTILGLTNYQKKHKSKSHIY